VLAEQQQNLQRSVQNLSEQKHQLEILLHRHACLRKPHLPITTANNLNLTKADVKTIPTTSTLLDSNNSKRVTINFTNAQDLFAVAPLTRVPSTTDASSSPSSASSSTVPMITIHIIPEVAQALLGSTSVDKAKLAELLQQANATNNSSTITPTTTANHNNNHLISDTMSTSTSTNSTS